MSKPKAKSIHPYIISKRSPTVINNKVKPIISEELDQVFVVFGNIVNIYSLTTGILVNTFRSKRQQPGNEKAKGDVHKGNICSMSLIKDKVIQQIFLLFYSCILYVQKDFQQNGIPLLGLQYNYTKQQQSQFTVIQLSKGSSIKYAQITDDYIVIYSSTNKNFEIYNLNSKSLLQTIAEQDGIGQVNDIAISGSIFAYIKARSVYIFNIKDKHPIPTIVQRESLLCSIDINQKGTLIAIGDEYGKIYIIHNTTKQLIVQSLHWHAHQVNSLMFMPSTPYLLSAGKESVIVQWHLETQNKTFISRLGNEIQNLNLSTPNNTYYSVVMSDNSIRIVRFDNNKIIVTINSFISDQIENIQNLKEKIISPYQSELLFYDIDQKSVQSLKVKPRNYVSSKNDKENPKTQIKSFCFTPDNKSLITFEELKDANENNKDIRLQYLKFWYRENIEDDVEGFQLVSLVSYPCQNEKKGLILQPIDNQNIVVVNGQEIIIWNQYERKKWSVSTQFNYQNLKVIQVINDVKQRITTQNSHSQKCLVFLHKDGIISYWDQTNFSFVYSLKLNETSKKIIFESSYRYLASLKADGGVEVWKIKGQQEKHWWDLKFKSVSDIVNIPTKENQFIITMNSDDQSGGKTDSILLFQFSRPQNLIMYWKLQLPFIKLLFVEQDPSYILIINKNIEIQKIYFGVTRNDLKTMAEKRRLSLDIKMKETEKELENKKSANYDFIEIKPERRISEERALLINQQDQQIRRLEKADQTIRESEFLGMPSLSFCFEQFAQEMLIKPSKATNLLDLQEELQNTAHILSTNQQQYDSVMDDEQIEDPDVMFSNLNKELEKTFDNLFK